MRRDVNDIPTDRELQKFHDMLGWIIEWHEENEAQATSPINAARILSEEIPCYAEGFTVT